MKINKKDNVDSTKYIIGDVNTQNATAAAGEREKRIEKPEAKKMT